MLWPAVPLEEQVQPYDHLPSTIHLGAFLDDSDDIDDTLPEACRPGAAYQAPVGVMTITEESYRNTAALPPDLQDPALSHRQLHKFGVLQQLQGRGVGSALLQYAMKAFRGTQRERVLLHLDARANQEGWYARFGIQRLEEGTFTKYGPTGKGPGVEYVHMGIILAHA